MPDTITINVKDGGIGLVGGVNPNAIVHVGVCSNFLSVSTPELMTFGQLNDIVATAGYGPAPEAAALQLATSGGQAYVMPVNASVAGSATVGTPIKGQTTSSGGVSAGSTKPFDQYNILIWVTNAPLATTGASGALISAGNVGIKISLDGGAHWGRQVLIPTDGVFELGLTGDTAGAVKGETGLVLTFEATGSDYYNVNDYFPITCVAPYYSSTDLQTALNALLADPRIWGKVNICGFGATSSATAAMCTTITQFTTAARLAYRYARAAISVPFVTGETDSTRATAFASVDDPRLATMACTDFITSPILGMAIERGHSDAVMARLAGLSPSTSPGRPDDGPLLGVVRTTRDERATPGLQPLGFDCARTIIGRAGVYADLGYAHVHAGSDYTMLVHGFVMDSACTGALQAGLHFQNTSIKLTRGGTIDPMDATTIENYIYQKIFNLVSKDCSSVDVLINLTQNIESTNTLLVDVTLVPFAYASDIVFTLAFKNPSLQLLAA